MVLSKSTTPEVGLEAEGMLMAVVAAVLFKASATFASERATWQGLAPTLNLSFVKLMWQSEALIVVESTRWISTFRMWMHFKAASLLMRPMPLLIVISCHYPIPLSLGLLHY